jgi:hypothetical protein
MLTDLLLLLVLLPLPQSDLSDGQLQVSREL